MHTTRGRATNINHVHPRCLRSHMSINLPITPFPQTGKWGEEKSEMRTFYGYRTIEMHRWTLVSTTNCHDYGWKQLEPLCLRPSKEKNALKALGTSLRATPSQLYFAKMESKMEIWSSNQPPFLASKMEASIWSLQIWRLF